MCLGSLILTACDSSISQEKFMDQYNATRENIALDSDNLDDVHMSNKLSVTVIDYKEGEYYINTTFVMALIIPVIQKYYYWKEDGKFYHVEEHTISSNNVDEEISEEQFNSYMTAGRAKVQSMLLEPFSACDNLMSDSPITYTNVTNKFTKSLNGTYKFASKMNYEAVEEGETVTKDRKVTFTFKNNLPVKYTIKEDSESYWNYSFGNSSLRKPSSHE